MKTLSLTFITSIRSAHPLASARDLASDRTHGRGPLRFSPSFACATITLCRQLHHTAPWHFPSKTKDFHQGGSTHLQIRSQSHASPASGCFNPETLSSDKRCGENLLVYRKRRQEGSENSVHALAATYGPCQTFPVSARGSPSDSSSSSTNMSVSCFSSLTTWFYLILSVYYIRTYAFTG